MIFKGEQINSMGKAKSPYTKITSRWFIESNVKAKIKTLLEEI